MLNEEEYIKHTDVEGKFKSQNLKSELSLIAKTITEWPFRPFERNIGIKEYAKCVVVEQGHVLPLYEEYAPWGYTREEYLVAKRILKYEAS